MGTRPPIVPSVLDRRSRESPRRPGNAPPAQAEKARRPLTKCALTSPGGVKCWGSNLFEDLGDNTTTGRLTPVDVVGLTSVVASIAVGAFHTCAVTTGGAAKCWGGHEFGEVGNGTTVASGLKCWGLSDLGQVGDGTETNRITPADVQGFATGTMEVATGAPPR